jgi:hypothetical protein
MTTKLNATETKFALEILKATPDEIGSEDKTMIRANRFGGPEIKVCPIVAKCIDFVYTTSDELENAYGSDGAIKFTYPGLTNKNVISNFDRGRAIVRKLDIDAYMSILD